MNDRIDRHTYALDVSGLDVDEAVQGYLEAQLWTTTDELWRLDYEAESALIKLSDGAELTAWENEALEGWKAVFGVDGLGLSFGERGPNTDKHHDENLDSFYSLDDIDGNYVEAVEAEVREFAATHPLAVRMYLAQRDSSASHGTGSASAHFGHDLLLTRDHHGVGFWDRGLGELGEYLTSCAERIGGSADLFDARLATEPHRATEPLLIAS